MKRFFLASLPAKGTRLTLPSSASHHLLNVVRAPRGTMIELFDGASMCVAELVGVDNGCATVCILSEHTPSPRRAERHLLLGIPKAKALDLALRMATELGVTHLYPVLAHRSVRREDKSPRWRRIVEAAAQQCGRTSLPTISPLRPFSDIGRNLEGLPTARFIAHPGGHPLERAGFDAVVAIGPEGGWTEAEFRTLTTARFVHASLAAHVLRTDTAVASALALLG